MKLAIITTHPIQYYAPLFRLLSHREKIVIKVFYTWEKKASSYDKDFAKSFEWDIPLLEGYDYEFVSNNGSMRRDFFGVRNPELNREIEAWGADAVLVFGWNHYSHLKAMRYFKNKIPVLFRGDSTLLDEKPGLKKWIRRAFLRWVYSCVDLALYVGKNSKNYFLAHGLKNDQLIFAPHAVDNERFYDIEGKFGVEAQRCREELGIQEQDIVFTFVGKFQAKKDPVFLIRAFNQITDPRARLLMVGDGELEPVLKMEAKGNPNIHFLPFQNQSRMPVIYRIGDIFCLPSRGPGETWGLAVNEAMACGRPVLVSDRCGSAIDLVINGQNGFIFTSEDKNDLIEKMEIFLAPDMDIRSMGLFSAHLIQSWSYNQLALALEKLPLNQTV